MQDVRFFKTLYFSMRINLDSLFSLRFYLSLVSFFQTFPEQDYMYHISQVSTINLISW
jgi:hypothetical protein